MLTLQGSVKYGVALVFVVLTELTFTRGLVGYGSVHGASTTSAMRCKGEEKDIWLSEFRIRIEEHAIYLYTVKLFNIPVACEAKITDTFNGTKFGTLLFSFTGGNVLNIETFPPEASRITLKVPEGFPDEVGARSVLERYTQNIGLRIDWSKPEERIEGDKQFKTFWDPESGFNAAARITYQNKKLIEIGYHMAP